MVVYLNIWGGFIFSLSLFHYIATNILYMCPCIQPQCLDYCTNESFKTYWPFTFFLFEWVVCECICCCCCMFFVCFCFVVMVLLLLGGCCCCVCVCVFWGVRAGAWVYISILRKDCSFFSHFTHLHSLTVNYTNQRIPLSAKASHCCDLAVCFLII